MYAKDVANYIVKAFQEAGDDSITNLKLQKILYYLQGWHLGLYGEPLFEDDFEAWRLGPVVPEVYDMFKEYGNRAIDKPTDDADLDLPFQDYINSVLAVYAPEQAWTLADMTHKELPWVNARQGLKRNEESNNIIPMSSIKKHFEEMAEKDEDYFSNLKNKPFQYNRIVPTVKDFYADKYASYDEVKNIIGW